MISSIDRFLRSMGWKIYSRRKGQEAEWQHPGGAVFGQIDAVSLARVDYCKRLDQLVQK